MRHLFRIAQLTALVVTASCTPVPPQECGPTNCSGCCQAGACQAGVSESACGRGGAACAPCQLGSPRRSHAMAYDSTRGKVMMFGGAKGSSRISQTWEYGP